MGLCLHTPHTGQDANEEDLRAIYSKRSFRGGYRKFFFYWCLCHHDFMNGKISFELKFTKGFCPCYHQAIIELQHK